MATLQSLTTTEWSSKDTANHFDVINPATGKVLTTVAGADVDTAAAAVAASKEAFLQWRDVPPMQRGMLLLKCADALEARKEEIAHLLCAENGKPYLDALMVDIVAMIGIFRFFGSLVGKLPSEFYDRGSLYSTVIYEPFGVCAGILPFNWPPIHTGGKLAPCLAAGNTMILKPGDQAPLTVLRIVEILQTVLPKNVAMAVPSVGPDVPRSLVENPDIKVISFTGSTATGSAVAQSAAKGVKPTLMELGGKNAMIVFDDADLDRAVADALEGSFSNKGEACTAASRIVVQESIYDEFTKRLSAAVSKLVSGNGEDPKTHIGPCVSEQAQQRVLSYIEKGKAEGAKILAQGSLPSDPACKNGFFVPPTLFVDVTRDMTIATEEIFGPVCCVVKFSTEQEAIDIANGTAYGLTAIIFSENAKRCHRVSRRLDVGMIWFNNYFRNVMGTPFGGVKGSGYKREHCIDTLKEFSMAKTMHQPSGMGEIPQWRGVADCLK